MKILMADDNEFRRGALADLVAALCNRAGIASVAAPLISPTV